MNITQEINYFYYHMSLYELRLMNGEDFFHGLSYNSLLYVNVIDQMRECTVSRLAEALGVTKSAVTLKINELVRQGIVTKIQSSEDRRIYYLTLSSEMRQLMQEYDIIFGGIERELRKQYSQEQLEQFGQILHTISGYDWNMINARLASDPLCEFDERKQGEGGDNNG